MEQTARAPARSKKCSSPTPSARSARIQPALLVAFKVLVSAKVEPKSGKVDLSGYPGVRLGGARGAEPRQHDPASVLQPSLRVQLRGRLTNPRSESVLSPEIRLESCICPSPELLCTVSSLFRATSSSE
eukprot:2126698-Rhodomonas_salina.1